MSPYDVILIVWDTFANNAARRGGGHFLLQLIILAYQKFSCY